MDVIEVPVAVEMEETLVTSMIIKIEVPATVKDNGIFNMIEGESKRTHFEVDEDNGMEMTLITVTETTGKETPMVKVILTGVEDGIIIIEVKDIVIGAEGEDGIPISNIMIQGINNKPNFQTQIIIIHHLWDINTDTQSHMSNTHTLNNNNNNINPKCRQLHLNKPQIFVSCVIIKDITIINANLQAILWPAHKKALIKADHTATKTRITGNGHMAIMMTMTLMGNLFSSDAADPPLRTLNVFYQGTNVEMLEETYFKFKKNILPKMKKMQPNFQEPVVEYCEPDQVIDICSYNHYPVLDKSSQKQEQHNEDNDIYDTSELEHKFEYGIYEDVLKTEQLMAKLKRIVEAEKENKKLRDVQFEDFPLEQFSDAGRVANEGDPHLKAAADTELYDLEKRAIQIDIDKHEYENSSDNTDDNSSPRADDNSSRPADDNSSPCADDDNSSQGTDDDIQQTEVSHMQLPTVGEKYHANNDDNTLCKMVYGPTYVPYNEDGQKLLLPQTTDMSRKDNLKLLYNSLPEGMCDNEYESLEQAVNDVETFQYSHETSTKHVLVQGVYVGSACPLIADIKTQPYSMLTYLDDGMMTGTCDNTHDIPIYIDNGSTLNIMPTHFYDNAYYLHHLPKVPSAAKTIHTGNSPVKHIFG